MFDIVNTSSFNKEQLTQGDEYDYVTRKSVDQGILQRTGFVNKTKPNEANVWSLGLLQMDFFYRERKWYAGQFIRKIIPKFRTTANNVKFFSVVLNKLKKVLLQVLVRNVDETFKNQLISLPTKDNQIDFGFMDSFVENLESESIKSVTDYLKVSGLNNYKLSDIELKSLRDYENMKWHKYKIVDIFKVKNTFNILSKDIIPNSGKVPYLSAGRDNNAVSSYISYDEHYLDKGKCIFIGGKTFVLTYQEEDFYSNDSHNLCLYMKDNDNSKKLIQFYMMTCIEKSLSHKYSWGNSISNRKIQNDEFLLPVDNNGHINYDYMNVFSGAVQKIVIKDVVQYLDKRDKITEL